MPILLWTNPRWIAIYVPRWGTLKHTFPIFSYYGVPPTSNEARWRVSSEETPSSLLAISSKLGRRTFISIPKNLAISKVLQSFKLFIYQIAIFYLQWQDMSKLSWSFPSPTTNALWVPKNATPLRNHQCAQLLVITEIEQHIKKTMFLASQLDTS